MESIYKEGSFVRKLVEHHIKYIETHGYDETIWITTSEHSKVNHRDLFPMLSQEELASISRKAYLRTEKAKEAKRDRIRAEISRIPTKEHMRILALTKPII